VSFSDIPLESQFSHRGSPRLEVHSVLTGQLVQGNVPLAVHDLGFGGFSVEGPIAFTAGSQHAFRFTTSGGMSILLTAEAIYSRPMDERNGMAWFLSGFRYVINSPEAEDAVQILIDAATSPLSFL
jgi:hypothetical protein